MVYNLYMSFCQVRWILKTSDLSKALYGLLGEESLRGFSTRMSIHGAAWCEHILDPVLNCPVFLSHTQCLVGETAPVAASSFQTTLTSALT